MRRGLDSSVDPVRAVVGVGRVSCISFRYGQLFRGIPAIPCQSRLSRRLFDQEGTDLSQQSFKILQAGSGTNRLQLSE